MQENHAQACLNRQEKNHTAVEKTIKSIMSMKKKKQRKKLKTKEN